MRIAVTGGTGFVGSALIDRALDDGHEIVALTRRKQEERAGVTWVPGDLDDREALARLVGDADMVIHVAGVVKARKKDDFAKGNVAGTLNLLETMRAAGPRRLVFVSSLAAREPGLSDYGASKAQAERLVRASPLDWTIVRPPAVFGPRDTEMLDLFRAAKWRIVPTPQEGRTSVIHVTDLVRLLLAMPEGSEDVTSRTFEPDDGVAMGWSHYELARAIGWAMGRRRIKVIAVSKQVMAWAARIDTLFRRSRARLTLDRAAYFSHPDWVAGREAVPPAGLWKPEVGTRDGLRATAEWYRAQGWL